MIPRLLKLPTDQNILLFGPRGTGKSTLLRSIFDKKFTRWINLLDEEDEQQLSLHPSELKRIVAALPKTITHVLIDEVQKIPKLLDIVHLLIEETDKKFVLTGSSARKLRYGGANLLAGRAFVYHLFPFSFLEIPEQFKLSKQLCFGSQPRILSCKTDTEKTKYLRSYTSSYLKEEISAEQVVKKFLPFRRFLEVAAQRNGKIINYANIARDTGIADTTVREYFFILEDTLVGFFLEPFKSSFRARLGQKPKFYFFDTGVVRALSRNLSVSLQPKTSAYGEAFEHFIILEATRLASYFYPEFQFSYIRTKDDAKIDLVVERPGLPLLCIEIKSSTHVMQEDLRVLSSLVSDLNPCEAVCLSDVPVAKRYGDILVLPWREGLQRYFANPKEATANPQVSSYHP